jgi:hypothetical protein
MVWKKTESGYAAPYYFFATYPLPGFEQFWLHSFGKHLSNDGTIIAHAYAGFDSVWKTHDTTTSNHGMTLVDVFDQQGGSIEGFPVILDKQSALLLEIRHNGPKSSQVWLQEGTSRSEISPYTSGPLAINLAASKKKRQ